MSGGKVMPDGALERMSEVLEAYKLINIGYLEWMDIMIAAANATTTKVSGVSKFYRYVYAQGIQCR